MYSFHESLIPFSSTITLPDTPFRQFDLVISCHSFTILFVNRKISFCWRGPFKSLAHSFCFFPFAKEITLFAFCLLFIYSFHMSFDFSFSNFHSFWPTVLSVATLAHCLVCLSVCLSVCPSSVTFCIVAKQYVLAKK